MKHTPRRAVRALALLAAIAGPGRTPVRDTLAASLVIGSSEGDVSALATDLRRAGLLKRGRGLLLAQAPGAITLSQITNAVCGHLPHHQTPADLHALASARMFWAMEQGLCAVTLDDVLRDARCLDLCEVQA